MDPVRRLHLRYSPAAPVPSLPLLQGQPMTNPVQLRGSALNSARPGSLSDCPVSYSVMRADTKRAHCVLQAYPSAVSVTCPAIF